MELETWNLELHPGAPCAYGVNRLYILYALLTRLIALVLAPLLAVAALADWRGMRQRLGLGLPGEDPDGRPLVWFHAASVGEVNGLARIVHAFAAAHPGCRVMATTMTATGLERAGQLVPEASVHRLVPLDTPFVVRRVVSRLKPRALVLVEGELWPALIAGVHRSGCPIALVNARMSDRSYPGNRLIGPLLRSMLRRMTGVAAQTPLDADRFVAFGADESRVFVTGNVKFDAPASAPLADRAAMRRALGLPDDALVIIAGCPRPVEEEAATLDACVRVHVRHPNVVFIWAPRHLDRLPHVQRMLDGADLGYALRSAIDGRMPLTVPVVLLDTMGELAAVYAAADMAFVGATLVPLGGHNLLEAAACGIPVVFGPHTGNVRQAADALLQSGGGMVVHNGEELADAWTMLIEQPEKRAAMGRAAAEAARTGDGALDRTMALLDDWIFNADRPAVSPHLRPG